MQNLEFLKFGWQIYDNFVDSPWIVAKRLFLPFQTLNRFPILSRVHNNVATSIQMIRYLQ